MTLKKTSLFERHNAMGAKIVPFAGYYMPIQYSSGIIDEHLTVRNAVGIFDVSHMGEFEVRGAKATEFINKMTTNNVLKLEVNQVQYSIMLYEDGGVVDDLLVYRFEDHYMLVVNAANLEKDFNWLHSHLIDDVQLIDKSDAVTLLAVQGPKALELVSKIADRDVSDVPYYHFVMGKVAGVDAIISRTGYTGEFGFELYIQNSDGEKLWDALFEEGKDYGIKPIGLGARDSLRLEAAYCLYGNDIDHTTNPVEAGLGWVLKTKKPGGFIGLDAVLEKRQNIQRKLIGFKLLGKGIPRHEQEIVIDGEIVGKVTSGGFSPILECGIGLGYINLPHNEVGTKIDISARGRTTPAEIVETPFYKKVD